MDFGANLAPFWSPDWTPKTFFFFSFDIASKKPLRASQERPKSVPRTSQERPRAPQGHPKRAPEPSKNVLKASNSVPDRLHSAQNMEKLRIEVQKQFAQVFWIREFIVS